MRLSMYLLLAFAVMFGVWSAAPLAAQGSTGGQVVATASAAPDQPIAMMQAPSGKLDVDISVNKGGGGGRWYANPVWIAIGGLAVIVLLVLIVMAVRGGGTTVVKG